ncbi:hypothetical protein AXF42_Ash014334 [Apostasia shenzhenica]|uniref:EF-hand domain-containing protein n=1 Tax=Apostasia shenzhenica TaxID=1088818 RepID=A0A2I0B0U8_9ASPA|nr:hypothetical protein AXF42_Ash014334 [Apostasia shenzhenica]
MAELGLTVLDGKELRDGNLRLQIGDGAVTGAGIVSMAEEEASARLFGLSLPDSVRSAALRRLEGGEGGDGGFLSMEFNDSESQKEKIREYLLAAADVLEDDPIVVSILDGSALREFLDDEDDFAMVAENLFTDLDKDDTGKLSKSELQNALAHMGVEMGVPPFSVCGDLLTNILKKHGAEGNEQLGQAQFDQLLHPILQDLADALAKKHVVIAHNIRVINGSRLKKILDDNELFDDITGRMFQAWELNGNGTLSKGQLKDLLQEKGLELGLPSFETSEALEAVYDQGCFSAGSSAGGCCPKIISQLWSSKF